MICSHDLLKLANVFVVILLPQVGKEMNATALVFNVSQSVRFKIELLLLLLDQIPNYLLNLNSMN